MAQIREISCSSAATAINSRFLPFRWDLNPYRGCSHGCKYCYAIYSHDYIKNSGGYFEDIYFKANIAEKLEEQLRKYSWKKEVINIGGVADCYQPAEREKKIMPQILEILIKYENPCIISTKSDLVLRDFDMIDELSRKTYVNVAVTVTCVDKELERKLEPKAPESRRRFEVLKEFSKTQAVTGVHMMPIIPFLTDSRENIELIYRGAAWCKAKYLLPGTINLRGKTKDFFTDFMKKEFPEKTDSFVEYFVDKNVRRHIKREIFSSIDFCRTKYGVTSSYISFKPSEPPRIEPVQLSLLEKF